MPGPIYIGGVIAGLKAARSRQRLHPGLVYKRLAEDGIKSAHSALNHFIFSSDKEGAVDRLNQAMYSAKECKSKDLAVGTWNAETASDSALQERLIIISRIRNGKKNIFPANWGLSLAF